MKSSLCFLHLILPQPSLQSASLTGPTSAPGAIRGTSWSFLVVSDVLPLWLILIRAKAKLVEAIEGGWAVSPQKVKKQRREGSWEVRRSGQSLQGAISFIFTFDTLSPPKCKFQEKETLGSLVWVTCYPLNLGGWSNLMNFLIIHHLREEELLIFLFYPSFLDLSLKDLHPGKALSQSPEE